jgi:uncharacterized caspase-like protein
MDHNLAIVVGINEYERLKKLKYAKQDALKIKGFLEERGEVESVLLFTDDSEPIDGKPTRATHTNLRDLFVSRFDKEFLRPEDNLWFFFSGHGQRHNQRDYLLPIDGNPRDIDGTGITVDFITDRLSKSGAGNIVLILDACRNVLTGGKGGGELGHEATERVRERGLISIFACQPEEQSWEEDALGQGIFTFALLKALQEGGCATAWQINSYLKNEVAALVKQYGKPPQTPYIVAEPIEKTHLILVLKNTREDDLIRLKKAALEQEAEEDFGSALELWNRVNIAAQGKDTEFYTAFKRIIAPKRQRELLNAERRQSEEKRRLEAEPPQRELPLAWERLLQGKVALSKSPNNAQEYIDLWSGFTGLFWAYNPSFQIENQPGTPLGEIVKRVFVPRFRNVNFKNAFYLFFTGDDFGKDGLKAFSSLMQFVFQQFPLARQKLRVRELKDKPATEESEIYRGTKNGISTAVFKPKGEPFTGGVFLCTDTELLERFARQFEWNWQMGFDVQL